MAEENKTGSARRKIQWGVLLSTISVAVAKSVPVLATVLPPKVTAGILTGAAVLSAMLPQVGNSTGTEAEDVAK